MTRLQLRVASNWCVHVPQWDTTARIRTSLSKACVGGCCGILLEYIVVVQPVAVAVAVVSFVVVVNFALSKKTLTVGVRCGIYDMVSGVDSEDVIE